MCPRMSTGVCPNTALPGAGEPALWTDIHSTHFAQAFSQIVAHLHNPDRAPKGGRGADAFTVPTGLARSRRWQVLRAA